MEHDEDYRRVLSVRNELQYQLSTLHYAPRDASAIEHLNTCINALKARRASILQDLDAQIALKNKKIDEHKKILEGVVDACNEIIKSGSRLYESNNSKIAAIAVWRAVQNLTYPKIIEEMIQVTFQPSLLDSIESYGKVSCTPTSTTCRAGPVTTILESGHVDGPNSRMIGPKGICFNPYDNCVYVCDSHNHVVRRITPEGIITSVIITKRNLERSIPFGIAWYQRDNCLYVTDKGYHTVKKITASGVEHVAGNGNEQSIDGMGSNASFSFPSGIAVDQKTGNVYVSETGSNCIRIILPNGQVATIAGTGRAGFIDGPGDKAEFNYPLGLCFSEKFRCLFVCDYSNNKLRAISATGIDFDHLVENSVWTSKGSVMTVPCDVYRPSSVTVASNGTILVTSLMGHSIIAINQVDGKLKSNVIAGMHVPEKQDGAPLYAGFNSPSGITLDEKANTCFVSDTENHTIRKFPLHYIHEIVKSPGYIERWKEFFALMDSNSNGFIEPAEVSGWNQPAKTLAKFWNASETSEIVQKSLRGMRMVISQFIKAVNPEKSRLSIPELLTGVENLFVGRTPATMPIWWKKAVTEFFEMNILDEMKELPYSAFYCSIKGSVPEEPDEKIYDAYKWGQQQGKTGKFDVSAALAVTFVWATSEHPEPEAVTITPFWRRL